MIELTAAYYDPDGEVSEKENNGFGCFEDKCANIIMTLKSVYPENALAASFSASTTVGGEEGSTDIKAKAVYTRATEHLSQLEDMFSFKMAMLACSERPAVTMNIQDTTHSSSNTCAVASDVAKNLVTIPEKADEMTAKVALGSYIPTNLSEYLDKAFVLENNLDQPLLSIRAAHPWWSTHHDVTLIEVVKTKGWPDSKKKFSVIESTMARALVQVGENPSTSTEQRVTEVSESQQDHAPAQSSPASHQFDTSMEVVDMSHEEKAAATKMKVDMEAAEELAVIEKAFPTGFPFKDRFELIKRLREFAKLFKYGFTPDDIENSVHGKKLAQVVLRAMAKYGRPRTLYQEMREAQCPKGISCVDETCEEAHLYRAEYLLDWDVLVRESGLKVHHCKILR